MRFVVIGAGAIGGSIGGRLALAGHDVVFVARGEHGAAIGAHGLRLVAPDGEVAVRAPVAPSIASVEWRVGDLALLAVKTQDAAGALAELYRCAPPPIAIACLTNGLEAERIAARYCQEVVGVCVMSPAEYLEAGVVRQYAAPVRGILEVGRFPHGATAFDPRLVEAFESAGYASAHSEDVMAWKRQKLLMNLGNIVEAMCGREARASRLVAHARIEAIVAMEVAGLSRVGDDVDERRREILRAQPSAGDRRSGGSTWQSVARGRALETDYLNGEVVLIGRMGGVHTPLNERLQRSGSGWRGPPGSLDLPSLEASVRDGLRLDPRVEARITEADTQSKH